MRLKVHPSAPKEIKPGFAREATARSVSLENLTWWTLSVEVPNSTSPHRMTISSVLRRSNVGAREREARNEADSRTDRAPDYVALSAGRTAGKRGP